MEVAVMEVDAFLADSVAVAENKIYAQGAGWDSIFSGQFPFRQSRIGIGVVLHVPWSATNQMHEFSITIVDPDGNRTVLGIAPPGAQLPDNKVTELRGKFNVGRPPLLNAGDSQVVPIAMNLDGLEFFKPDTYTVDVSVDGTSMRRLPIHVRSTTQIPGVSATPQFG